RDLAVLSAGVTAMKRARAQQKPAYGGALAKFEGRYDPELFDSLAWTRRRYEEMPRQLAFRARNRREALAWQRRLRAKLVELLGGFPARTPLRPQVLEVKEFPAFTRESVIFESRPGLGVFGYFFVPKNRPHPRPALICVPGHGRGADDIAGIDEKGQDRTEKGPYQYDFAVQAAERGFAAFAIEPLGFGCRRDPASRRRGLGQSSCQPAAGAALLFGETMTGWRVWDVIRTVDYLETRSEVDSRRIGLMGISGGGTITTFGAALEPRIAAALVSGYLNTFRDSILSISHCMDNYVPGILHWCEMHDVAGLIAPRPLFCESGEKDDIFPVEAFRRSFSEVQKIYRIFGAEENLGSEIFPKGHEFCGRLGFPFLEKHLGA
ncbi:MAG: alpha/beta hydrolase family protein, partial [Bryobacteraceae bacterium]|nr:alpha/beta hydrolase family protein [Bryobacteraceae bacterium]